MESSTIATYKMLSGHTIPCIGLGTYLIGGRNATRVLDDALSLGYRAFDTATMYDNEECLGLIFEQLLPKHNLKRQNIFLTTKLYPSDHGTEATNAIKTSIKNLRCEYLDLYLIHWPGCYGVSSRSAENLRLRTASWAAMVKAKEEGLVRDIGVSNYTVTHLQQLLNDCQNIKPAINQVEWHPACHQKELKDFCDKEGIILQAYMPLGGNKLLNNPVVCNVAEKLGKTTAQVLLRWSLQQNIAVIPKASSREHLKENLDVNFVIPPKEFNLMSGLQNIVSNRNYYNWRSKSKC
ncbi:hypothetical protein FQA39_LY07464 [Lamprigera yunnana]|nr:hypothetical protein FQA39_LY07464 [Lamprigera yunnana]